MKEMELILREELFPNWIIYALLFSMAVLSVLKYQKEMVFTHLKGAFFKAPSNLPNVKESLSFSSSSNWALLLNYFAVAGISVYMLLIYFERTDFWMVILPTVIYLFQLFSLLFVGVLSGEFKKVRENIFLLNFTAHITGLVLIPLLFVWLLNPHLSKDMVNGLAIVFLVFYILRVLRGMFLGIRNKVLWYYIILYLCGLEIWPIIVGIYFYHWI